MRAIEDLIPSAQIWDSVGELEGFTDGFILGTEDGTLDGKEDGELEGT